MTLSDNARLIESILYLENEPLSVERIGKMTGLSDKAVSDALSEISEVYYSDNHGLALVENSETYSFVPVSSLNDKLRSCYGRKIDKRLSK
ncbi:MAG: SMC-Scp complex subunit ScpB, partial [Spirochaetales bacterium]|nr:SMC-Scp complex subunit ScpB [Spirochaetales bacterium]